jgi:DMSO/TMAO reductase YedYZ molybdopterin-dependent catalytic subunit
VGGTPLRPLLEEAGVENGAVEIVFAGLDRGVESGIEHDYERSLTVADALAGEALLAWELNGAPLPPQHGFPLRLVVPGWYGMASVKWLARITAVDSPFDGFQQAHKYRLQLHEHDPGEALARIHPRALLIPPGIPEFLSRSRIVAAGRCEVAGRARSGMAPVAAVEVSVDGGASWAAAELQPPPGRWAWARWRFAWEAEPGEHELCCRARDEAGNEQPLEPTWNAGGYVNNAVQRVAISVR